MVRVLLIIILPILLGSVAQANHKNNTSHQICIKLTCDNNTIEPFDISNNIDKKQKDVVEQRGCCSWHSGVCGCTGGRAVCCDGSFSPSCGC